MVFGEDKTHGTSRVTTVGPPAGLDTLMVPSNAASRRITPSMPVPDSRVGATTAVVADDRAQHPVGVGQRDPRVPGAGVPDDVGQALGDGEVDGRLDRVRRPTGHPGGDLDRDRHVERERLDRATEPAVGEHRRVDAADHRAQVAERGGGGGAGLADQPPGLLRVGLEQRVGHAEGHRQGDQPGLGAVVQVALDPAQLGGRVVQGLGAGLGEHLDALLEHLGVPVAEEPPVHRGPRPHDRLDPEPPEGAGHDEHEQQHGEQGEREAEGAGGERARPGRARSSGPRPSRRGGPRDRRAGAGGTAAGSGSPAPGPPSRGAGWRSSGWPGSSAGAPGCR